MAADQSASETLLTLFGRSARAHPERAAVSDGHGMLTYRRLDERSDELANSLCEAGVARGDTVAVHIEPGTDVFVAILGVLKAGAAYVPVDVRYPEARRDHMVMSSGARLVLADPAHASGLAGLGVPLLDVCAPPRPFSRMRAVAVSGADAACVLFTSGSSGVPKGVVLEHRNLVHFAVNPALPALAASDRVGQVSSLSFDAFTFETWCALAVGAEVVVLQPIAELIADDLGKQLRRNRITVLLAPTMAVNHVVHVDRDAFSSLRLLHTGGDVLQPAAAAALASGSFTGRFSNLYGPTEGTTAATVHHIESTVDEHAPVPIGRALADVAVHVLDDRLNEVPPGAVGELHIGGNGVARGYLGQPELTAQRFIADPFSEGGRLYATGDLARLREDGTVDFLGRRDGQVKIRGYRVEPAEVEHALLRHERVRDVAAVAVGEDHDRRLVALVVPHEALSLKDLRSFAEREMPHYLVPSTFVRVAAIPGTDHGKRDLVELRRLAVEQTHRQARGREPRDEVERCLVGVWEELLTVERVGADDDFFELGGNSMQAFRLRRRIRQELGVEVQVREIIDVRELAGLAELVRTRGARA